MGGESNEGEMGFKHGDDESGISRVGVTSMPLYAKADHFFSSADWDPVVNVGGFSSSHYSSVVMDNPGMSCFTHYQPGSGYPDMPTSLLPFVDCGDGGGGHFLGSDKNGDSVGRLIRAGESHDQVSDDGVLGVSPNRKRRQAEAESQRNKVGFGFGSIRFKVSVACAEASVVKNGRKLWRNIEKTLKGEVIRARQNTKMVRVKRQ